MAKVGIDVTTAPRQAGYIADNSSISGISLMHDEGTGGNTNGGYGIFPLFPLADCDFTDCPVLLSEREALRAEGADGEPTLSIFRVSLAPPSKDFHFFLINCCIR
jgi:hypothetical protein